MSLRMREKSEVEKEEQLPHEESVVLIPTFPQDQDRHTLGMDVFWLTPEEEHKDEKENMTQKEDDEEEEEKPTIFPTNEMSYQMYILQAAWLNANLNEYEIGMALSPRLCRCYKWPYTQRYWQLNKTTMGEQVYYGTGEGSLHKVGVGGYFDKMCLEKAKICGRAMGSTRNRLSIRAHALAGVVVDADPFLHWFGPKRPKCINFKDNSINAGFYLSDCMKKVSILCPRRAEEPMLRGRRVYPLSELKVIELKGGKKVGEIPYRGPRSLKENIPRNVDVGGCKQNKSR